MVVQGDDPRELANDGAAFVPHRVEQLGPNIGGHCPPFRPGAANPGPPPVFYRPDELVTQARFADDVAALLDGFGGGERLEGPKGDDRETRPVVFRVEADPLALTRALKAAIPDLVAGPHHIMTLAPSPMIGPGSEPWPAKAEWEPGPVVEGVTSIAVVDTGLWKDPPADGLTDLQQNPQNDDDPLDRDGDHEVDWYGGGHGGFITGVIRSRACNIEVIEEDAFQGGALTEQNVVTQVEQALAKSKSVILNLSLGSYRDRESGGDLVFLQDAMERWRASDLLVVAAAGNDGTTEPFYPAAYAADPRYADCVVSVGALEAIEATADAADARPASFSNHGGWVVAWAPGEGIVSHYPAGKRYRYRRRDGSLTDPVPFDTGFAHWSGTSFATPFVAAEIVKHAARLTAQRNVPVSPKEAWKDLRAGRPFVVFWP